MRGEEYVVVYSVVLKHNLSEVIPFLPVTTVLVPVDNDQIVYSLRDAILLCVAKSGTTGL
jgi:hypothetical protein